MSVINYDLRSYATNPAGNDIGVGAYQRARQAGLSASQISQLAQQQSVRFGTPLQGLIVNEIVSDVSLGFNNQLNILGEQYERQAGQQQSQYQSSQQNFQNQLSQQQSQYQAQQAQFANLQNARVPSSEKSAQERRAEGSSATPKKQSGLSSLALVSGLGTNANPLSGLQLA